MSQTGGGKSTLIRKIALAYAYPERRLRVYDGLPDKDWFLVYIKCRDLESSVAKSILEIIGTIVQRAEISKYKMAFEVLVENALQDGRILLLIDGLDEISEERYRICLADQLRTFVATYPNVHLLITSRKAGFGAVAATIPGYCKQYTMEQGQQKISRDELQNCIIKARRELPEILGYTEVSPSKFIE